MSAGLAGLGTALALQELGLNDELRPIRARNGQTKTKSISGST
jgi:hypothetical protein